MKAIYITPTVSYQAVVAGEPQSLVTIAVWSGHPKGSVTLSFETTIGEDPNDASSFTVCVNDARTLLEAIAKALN